VKIGLKNLIMVTFVEPITLVAGAITATIEPDVGARISSFRVHETEFLTPQKNHPLEWGMYPMAPFAGRVRNAQFMFNGTTHDLVADAEPHAIHGTTYARAWRITERTNSSLTMTIGLGANWPMLGKVTHEVRLTPTSLQCLLRIDAEEAMPAQVGWHPWFYAPQKIVTDFDAMLQRDPFGIATSKEVPVPNTPVDDCFVRAGNFPQVSKDGITVEIISDCSHWVRYDAPNGDTCIEPQSGPPNQINDSPIVIAPGAPLMRRCELRVLTL
jgi:aldose 1-epimerase